MSSFARASIARSGWGLVTYVHLQAPPQFAASLLAASRGSDGWAALDRDTREWSRALSLPKRFWIHEDVPAALAATALGCSAFTRADRIYLGNVPAALRRHVLRHELVHLAQVRHGSRSGRIDARSDLEYEAERWAAAPAAGAVTCAAHPEQYYGFWWVPIGIGLYILLRPSVANAPGPKSRVYRSPSLAQITTEALAFMLVPGGACALGARIGLGFWGTAMLGGAASTTSTRLVSDAWEGQLSPPLYYVYDIATGAILGFVVPGGIRLVGYVGTRALTSLATYGMERSGLAVTQALHDAALVTPLDATQAFQILNQKGLIRRVSQWWLDRQNLVILTRGQEAASAEILSPLAREQGVIASEALVQRMRLATLTEEEIAGYSAMHQAEPIPAYLTFPELAGERLGATGIPTSELFGVAAGYAGPNGVVYLLRVPRSEVIKPLFWPRDRLEFEQTILNVVPSGSIVKMIPASRIAPLSVTEDGLLAPRWKN
ncbi:MAG TPA: DUF4157 domain-containing protein [Polyangiales bacterium]|nr:DUF4157 domain-containing protein [Polyangiales bacterium]